jgi:hypothetical protein
MLKKYLSIAAYMKKVVILLLIIGSYALGTAMKYKQQTYEGKTAKEWANLAKENKKNADYYFKNYLNEIHGKNKNPFFDLSPTPSITIPK